MKLSYPAMIPVVLALFSCAPPKAIVVEQAPVPKKPEAVVPAVPEPAVPATPDDGIRMPDMLTMPGDEEFHPGPAGLPAKEPSSGAVISRPPTDPPPRPKPKEAGE
jgi:hypothetical protein